MNEGGVEGRLRREAWRPWSVGHVSSPGPVTDSVLTDAL